MTPSDATRSDLPRYRRIPDACPKCGLQTPWDGPRYNQNLDVLTWTCRRCLFVCATPTLDAIDPLQGWRP